MILYPIDSGHLVRGYLLLRLVELCFVVDANVVVREMQMLVHH